MHANGDRDALLDYLLSVNIDVNFLEKHKLSDGELRALVLGIKKLLQEEKASKKTTDLAS